MIELEDFGQKLCKCSIIAKLVIFFVDLPHSFNRICPSEFCHALDCELQEFGQKNSKPSMRHVCMPPLFYLERHANGNNVDYVYCSFHKKYSLVPNNSR